MGRINNLIRQKFYFKIETVNGLNLKKYINVNKTA